MKKRKILIVEDEMLSAMDLAQILQRRGYEVCELVTTGEEAVATAESAKPDIALIDVNLRGTMSGLDAAGRIRSAFGIPVIFMTGYSDEETRAAAALVRPTGYFIKPFNVKALLEAIEAALHKA